MLLLVTFRCVGLSADFILPLSKAKSDVSSLHAKLTGCSYVFNRHTLEFCQSSYLILG